MDKNHHDSNENVKTSDILHFTKCKKIGSNVENGQSCLNLLLTRPWCVYVCVYAGILWNLSSKDNLKDKLARETLPELTEKVLIPLSGGGDTEDIYQSASEADIYYNTTGCLRWASIFVCVPSLQLPSVTELVFLVLASSAPASSSRDHTREGKPVPSCRSISCVSWKPPELSPHPLLFTVVCRGLHRSSLQSLLFCSVCVQTWGLQWIPLHVGNICKAFCKILIYS